MTALLTELEDAAVRSLVTEAVSEQREIPNRAQQIADVVKRLRDKFIDRRLAGLVQRMHLPALPDSERDELLQQQHPDRTGQVAQRHVRQRRQHNQLALNRVEQVQP